ncbi:MAG: iron-containing redox enzyme family protein [Planctomycetota bacterium]
MNASPENDQHSLHATVERVRAEFPFEQNPYFRALSDGTFEHGDFVATQIQFYYAVVFFSRPMAAVAAKIPSASLRVEVLRNVWEEHGEGASPRMHGETFKVLLERLGGLDAESIDRTALWPELRAFNTALIGCCVLDDWEVGTACLGMIERMFVDISAFLGSKIVERQWLMQDDLVHYDVHETLDVRHSDDFFQVIQHVWDRSPSDRYVVEQGLQLGAYLFDQLYRGLYAARRRRVDAPSRFPQERVYAG